MAMPPPQRTTIFPRYRIHAQGGNVRKQIRSRLPRFWWRQDCSQRCSVLYGNTLIGAVVAEITSPDLKSPSYQDLILASPSVGARGGLKPGFLTSARLVPGDAKIKSWYDD
jgi:hypothetical protein